VEFLSDNGAFADLKDNNGDTALDIARRDPNKTSERIVSILERSSNLRQDDLWRACRNGNMEKVIQMRSKGKHFFNKMLHFTDSYFGQSCLIIAIENGYMDVCKYLVLQGANIHDKDDQGIKGSPVSKLQLNVGIWIYACFY